ncbi:hypothetical protein ACWC0C_19860 [Streptomyces sp. NPDC001709]
MTLSKTEALDYDHSAFPPELRIAGSVAGREAQFTLRPALAEVENHALVPRVAVRVSTRYRIPLVFNVLFRQCDGDEWKLVSSRCDQDNWLESVRKTRPQAELAAAKIVEDHRSDLAPLLLFSRERSAAHALAEVYRARSAATQAHQRLAEAEAEFALYGIGESRAGEVHDQIHAPLFPGRRTVDVQPHTGRPVIRPTSYGRVLVLCPLGHLVQSVKTEDWGGSALAARYAEPDCSVTCHGRVSEVVQS